MDDMDRRHLQKYYSTLLDVMYSCISPHLISSYVLSLKMHEEIDNRPTERKKMESLLQILPSRGDHALKELITALKPSYGWIARKLERECGNNRRSDADHLVTTTNKNLPDFSISDYIREITRLLQKNVRVCTHWTFLANSMGLLPTTVMDIKREMAFSGGCEYAIYAVLDSWVTKVGSSKATFAKLISLLNGEGMNQCGEEVQELWASLSMKEVCGSDNSSNDGYDITQSQSSSQSTSRRREHSPVITDV